MIELNHISATSFVMRPIAGASIGTSMDSILQAIHHTDDSDVKLSLAFVELSICCTIINRILSRKIVINLIYFLVAPVYCSRLPKGKDWGHSIFKLSQLIKDKSLSSMKFSKVINRLKKMSPE